MEKLKTPFKMDTLLKYGSDLTQMALEHKFDPVIGRENEMENVMRILCKRKKNNPCLIGEPGVGKTVVAEGLAQKIVNEVNLPPRLEKKKVISLDMARLIGGASNRGEFEERLTNVVDEVKQSEGEIILFIDEIHTLVGTGSGGTALDAANILKPALARGELKCIGATTHNEYRKHIEEDSALERRFQPVLVPEPSVEDAILILQGLRKLHENFHNVRYTDEALVAAVRLSKQDISGRFLPDKAIDLIDEAGAHVQLHQANRHVSTQVPLVTEMDMRRIVSAWAGMPLEKISQEESGRLLNMEKILHEHVIGQDEAVVAISQAIRRARVGVRNPDRPIASFIFSGPTGVGKTELAKVLASEYFGTKEAMIRLDMSEYMERHSVAKLIGSPPGYIGHEDGGQLTKAVRRRCHTVILFDEIEKAHPDVFNILLQILEDGRLTDCKGRTLDFKNTILIMTSNIGCSLIIKQGVHKSKVAEELGKYFRPEFLNRLDEVIVFRSLTKLEIKEIANKMLDEVCKRLEAKKIFLQVTEAFKDKLVEQGYRPQYGARPLRRAITRLLEDKLADKILSGDIKEGDSILVSGVNGELKKIHYRM
ncbi:chaperone protein ClpC2, chloroplastic-like [Telopea speciosissima]|uniref:chaperone protein ClpC2, chloroplastic-like n=1 Tax=Telopea speciosissima TaxID=54955 RepID=UPI001CC6B0D0|nr:chaperone protein ClpC2, chloroplastic-like [Telopea speciosissima]